jgi:hypothetical protein
MEAFVYIWKNLTNGCQYIGYHKGSKNDGYISSSSSERFWQDFKNPDMQWDRQIIAEGTAAQCLKIEQNMLKTVNINSDLWYNNARGAEIIFTEEVKDKIRQHHLGGSSGMKGKKHSNLTKNKIALTLKGREFTEEHLKKLRKPNKDASNKKGPKSKEHKMAMKEAHKLIPLIECPHCGRSFKPALAKRWHFDNCKLRKV